MCFRIKKFCHLVCKEDTETYEILAGLGCILTVLTCCCIAYFIFMGIGIASFILFGFGNGSHSSSPCSAPLVHWADCPLQGFFVILIFVAACAILGLVLVGIYFVCIRPMIECKKIWDDTATQEIQPLAEVSIN